MRRLFILFFLLWSTIVLAQNVKVIGSKTYIIQEMGNATFVKEIGGGNTQLVFPASGTTILYEGSDNPDIKAIIASGVVSSGGVDPSVTIALASTGTGAGVAMLRLQSSADVVLTLSGSGKFYSNEAGNADESSTWTCTAGALRTRYIKVPSGTSDMVIADGSLITKLGDETTIGWDGIGEDTNAPTMTATNWAQCTNLTNLSAYSCNLTGSVAEWSALTDLTYLRCNSTSVSGDVSGWSALTDLTYLRCYSTSIDGNVSGWSALTDLTVLSCASTSIDGNVSGWSALTDLIYLSCHSTSVSGDVSGWSALTDLIYLYCYSTAVGWSGTGAWSIDAEIQFHNCNWNSTEVNNCLASLAGGPVTGSQINIAGNNAARTSASDADVAIITNPANNNTLTVNE